MTFSLDPIGIIHSCFKGDFAVPRQAGLVPSARAELELLPPYDDPQALDGLEQCTHLWLQFIFHREAPGQWKPRVRPPRLGGNRRIGVFATRSPRRPNGLGLSAVRLERIELRDGKPRLLLSGVDLVDGTPVVDIKPYVPYADALPDARNGLAPEPPGVIPVCFSAQALAVCASQPGTDLAQLITEVLQQDPRPAYQQPDPNRRYGTRLQNWELGWQYESRAPEGWAIRVTEIAPAKDP